MLTSRREGWSLAIVEALASGCPVLSVDCETGPREVLAGGRYGVLVQERDPEAIGRALLHMLTQPSLLGRLRRRGPRRAAEFARPAVARAWLQVLTTMGS